MLLCFNTLTFRKLGLMFSLAMILTVFRLKFIPMALASIITAQQEGLAGK